MAKYDINLRDYWRIIRKRRAYVILATILFTVFSYFFALIRMPKPLYEAISAVKVERATDLTTLLLGTVSWTTWDNVSAQAVIITSFPVMERSAREMGLIPDALSPEAIRSDRRYLDIVTNLKSKVETEQEGNTNIINITASSETPEEAALIANTVAEVFRQTNIEERNKRVRETREFIESQLGVVRSRLQTAEENLRNFRESTKLVAIDAQTLAIIDLLTSLENEVAQLRQRKLEVREQLGLLKLPLDGALHDQEGFYVEAPPPQLAALNGKLKDLSLQRKVLLNYFTEEHPEVQELDAKLRNVLAEMDGELKSMLVNIDSRQRELEKRLLGVRAKSMTIPESALALARLRREVEINSDLLAQLKSKYQEVMIQESGLIEEVRTVKPALEPTQPVNPPKTMVNTLAGSVIGLIVGLVLALVVETMDTSLGTIEDVEEILKIPVLGVIPSTDQYAAKDNAENGGARRTEPLVTHFAPRTPVAEAYRSLRTNFQFMRTDKKAKSFLVTSSSLQEGKTYNVVNLSLSLAQAGERVLLIDADLRRPSVHQIFGLERQPGVTDYIMEISGLKRYGDHEFGPELSELLETGRPNGSWRNVTNSITDVMLGKFGIDDILKTPGLDSLHIVTAGQSFLNPAEILRSPRFKEFLREVKEYYDVVIVDTPPVLPVSDAFEVAPEVDGVILVYEVGRIGRGIVNRAKVQLENVHVNVLGVILNNVKPEVAPDFYRYRTDYYYEQRGEGEKPVRLAYWRNLVMGESAEDRSKLKST